MPEISRFFGIVIYMNWRDHPPVHFHAIYGEYEASITLDGKVYSGALPVRALSHHSFVNDWPCTATKLQPTGSWRWSAAP